VKPLSFVKSRLPSEAAGDIDLDVTPIMSMFIILIPFLVSMAVLTRLSILEFSLPPNVGAGLDASQGKPKLKLTVVVAPSYIALAYGERLLDSLPAVNGALPLAALQERLSARKEAAETKDEIIVAVNDSVPVKSVVRVMDRCRSSGFAKIGLSSAAGPGTAP
jgi:biopolymer transport protein ExbD